MIQVFLLLPLRRNVVNCTAGLNRNRTWQQETRHIVKAMDHSKQASQLFDKLAGLYQSKYMNVSAYEPALNNFISLLTAPSPAILEIACGPGNVTKHILAVNPKLNVFGIDLAPGMIELAKLNCPGAQFEVMDCRQINSLLNTYDGVIVSFCLPYLNKTESQQLLKDIAALLKPGGKLYLSTIEGPHQNSGYKKASTGDEIFLNYYELADLAYFMSQARLQIISTERVSFAYGNNDIDLVLVAGK
jgi:ubiquinone/menaquinone biosynthesis C-methylase UbiE